MILERQLWLNSLHPGSKLSSTEKKTPAWTLCKPPHTWEETVQRTFLLKSDWFLILVPFTLHFSAIENETKQTHMWKQDGVILSVLFRSLLFCFQTCCRISVSSKSAATWTKNGVGIATTGQNKPPDVALGITNSPKNKRTKHLMTPSGLRNRNFDLTRPLGNIRDQGTQQQLSELMPKLVEAVAGNNALKDNRLYSFEIEERTEDEGSEVHIKTSNQWVYMRGNCLYLVDDSEARLPQIGGETASVVRRVNDKEIEVTLKLTSHRRQKKAWKDIVSKRKVLLPLQFKGSPDCNKGIYISQHQQLIQSARDSIRQVLESRMASSSLSCRTGARPTAALTNSTVLVSLQPDHPRPWSLSSYRKPEHDVTRTNPEQRCFPTLAVTAQSRENSLTSPKNRKRPQLLDAMTHKSSQETELDSAKRKTLELDLGIMTQKHTRIQKFNDGCQEISSGLVCHPEPTDVSKRCIPVTFRQSLASSSRKQIPWKPKVSHSSNTGDPTGPRWPTDVEIQRLKTGGFTYRQHPAKRTQSTDGVNSKESEVTAKKAETIVVPSHTLEDCPFCNLYQVERWDHEATPVSVYQRSCGQSSTFCKQSAAK